MKELVWESVMDDSYLTLDQLHGCGIDEQKFARLYDKVRTTHPITTKLSSCIPLGMLVAEWCHGAISQEWSVQHATKKCIGWILGWSLLPWSLTSGMTLTLNFSGSIFKDSSMSEIIDLIEKETPCFFKDKVWNRLISSIRRLIVMEQKGCKTIIHGPDHDLGGVGGCSGKSLGWPQTSTCHRGHI